jgi:DNA-binding FadR family transcriptional regulator
VIKEEMEQERKLAEKFKVSKTQVKKLIKKINDRLKDCE